MINKIIINIFVLLLLSFLCSTNYIFAAKLLDWNDINVDGTSWSGWSWYPHGANDYGAVGWRYDDGQFVSGNSNWMPRIHEKTDYGNSNSALLDVNERAPSTSIGASLKVYDTGVSNTYQSCWWYFWSDNFGSQGIADNTTDRLSFYFKPTGIKDPQADSSNISTYNIHFGTYLCWPGGSYGAGKDCPTEANGQHYYHYLTVNDDAWLHVLLDRHPQHKRGASLGEVQDNPASPKNYYEYMNSFYLEIRQAQSSPTAYWVDEIELYTSNQDENDISITSVWVGYWPNTDKWEIGFNDNSFSNYNNDSKSTFEIRYSTALITNTNYSSALIIDPVYHEVGTTKQIKRPNSWKRPVWTRFTLPDTIEVGGNRIYFAIKDVSSVANGDGHNAPSSNIHTIDYVIAATSANLLPAAPTGVKIIP
ncbi:MAG: hypothetical protein MRK01_00115 [Candidatus Scalindua sp.]|nr:hypothetical protein [Candidatus Scalindua sp.]